MAAGNAEETTNNPSANDIGVAMASSSEGLSSSKLRVLVCSGNLGNAEPDGKSLAAWIPADGNCDEVLQNQKYPLVSGQGTLEVDNGVSRDMLLAEGRPVSFDLIVLGLQESTFIPTDASQEVVDLGVKDNDNHDKHINNCGDPAIPADSSDVVDPAEQTMDSRSSTSVSDSLNSATASKATESSSAVKTPKNVSSRVPNLLTRQSTMKIRETLVTNSTTSLHQKLQDQLPSYTQLLSHQRGEMRLLVYSRSSSKARFVVKSARAKNTGVAGLPNKGGIVVEIEVNETTTLSFMSCHLEAHEGISKYKRRCSTLGDILKGTTERPYPDVSLNSHFCFVLGDLNFRTRYQGHVYVKEQGSDVQALVSAEDWEPINETDELQKALQNDDCLAGFRTLYCNFPPTFKVERDKAGFVYQEKRTPSYTDRILWRTGSLLNVNIEPLAYEPIPSFTSSDHKPIRGAFDVQLNANRCEFPDQQHQDQQSFSSFSMRGMSWMNRYRHRNNVGASRFHKKLHLYLSGVQCDIFPNSSKTSSCGQPGSSSLDTYVTLISNPMHLLFPPKTQWKKLRRCLRGFRYHHDDDKSSMLAQCPSTPVSSNTLNPRWNDEEIHCYIQGCDSKGRPSNVGGAMLHIAVMRAPDDELVGSFPVNLEYLFRQCCGFDDDGDIIKKALESSDQTHQLGITMHGSTTRNDMVSWDINGPLLKNGQQTGILRCSLDGFWATDGLAHAFKAKALEHGLSSNDVRITRAMEANARGTRWWRGNRK